MNLYFKIMITVAIAFFSYLAIKLIYSAVKYFSFVIKYRILKKKYVPSREVKMFYNIKDEEGHLI